MECIFLGHQSWLFSYKDTHILLDPVLNEDFGNSDIHSIEIFPPRTISFPKEKKIHSIILSHEHTDHFHLPSLVQFAESEILFGPNMYDYVENLINEVSLRTKRVFLRETISLGDFEVILYPPHINTILWESRVTQVYIRPKDKPEDAVFIGVDALTSEKFIEDIEQGYIPPPKLLILSNNAQITPYGVLGTLDSHKDPAQYAKKGSFGVSILNDILFAYTDKINCDNFAICGGGFTKKYEEFMGAYMFSDQKELAFYGQKFFKQKQIFGPQPGDVITVFSQVRMDEKVDWIEIDHPKLIFLKERSYKGKDGAFSDIVQQTPLEPKNYKSEIKKCLISLKELSQHLLLLPHIDREIHKKIEENDPIPFIFLFKFRLEKEHYIYYALNVLTNIFEELTDSHSDIEQFIPFGIEIHLSDYVAMVEGNLQIWDLAGISMKGWHPGTQLESAVASLYMCFGEACRPDLAYLNLKKRWNYLIKKENV